MAILVTGGTGFVGSNIVRTLAQRGHEVISFDAAPADHLVRDYVAPWGQRVTFVQGNLLSRDDLGQLDLRSIDKIVHAAVFTGVLPGIETACGHSIVEINVLGTTNLLELARRAPLKRFLYVSSASVYGGDHSADEVLQEERPPRPDSLYAITKYTSELLTRRYGELHGFQAVNGRLHGPYGPMERVTGHRANQGVLKEWTGRAVRGEPIEVSDRSRQEEFTYVVDIAEALAAVLDAPTLSHDVYNVCSGQRYTFGEVIASLQGLFPDLQVRDSPSDTQLSNVVRRVKGLTDPSRLREDIGFSARFDLAAGLRGYLAWRQAFQFAL